jgi:prophage DNA circulation protein
MRGTIREAITVLTPVLAALADAVVDASAGAEFRRALGVLKSDLSNQVESGEVVASLSSLFDLAIRAGTTVQRMERVRVAAEAQTPFYLMGRVLMALSVRLALITETRVISQTTFASRTDVEALLAHLNDAFDSAEQDASANREAFVYRALVNLHAATVRDLLARSRPLPRMTTYTLARPTSAIRLAHRLYYNASRAEELWRENRAQTPHPLFMRPEGRALSA